VLTFDIKSTNSGSEIQGIMLGNGEDAWNNSSNAVQIFGNQSWGTAPYTSETLDDGWIRVEVDMGTISNNGAENLTHITFINDDDNNNNPTDNIQGTVSFRNVSISDSPIDGGDGEDTLVVDGGILDLSNISQIEIIELGDNATIVEITASDVISMTDGDNELIINGDATNTVSIDSSLTLDINANNAGYDTYTGDGATLLIETPIDTV